MTRISRLQYFSETNMSKMVRVRAVVTIEYKLDVIYDLSNGVIFSDLERLLSRILSSSKANIIQTDYID